MGAVAGISFLQKDGDRRDVTGPYGGAAPSAAAEDVHRRH